MEFWRDLGSGSERAIPKFDGARAPSPENPQTLNPKPSPGFDVTPSSTRNSTSRSNSRTRTSFTLQLPSPGRRSSRDCELFMEFLRKDLAKVILEGARASEGSALPSPPFSFAQDSTLESEKEAFRTRTESW